MEDNFHQAFEQYPDTTICFGNHAFQEFTSLLLQLRPDKVMVFTGHNSADNNGGWQKLLHASDSLDLAMVRYREIGAEPDIDTLRPMVEALARETPDVVVAMGGGSVMDATKAALLIHHGGGNAEDFFGSQRFSQSQPNRKLPKTVCFPTTSGTGSEVTPYSNIVDRANQCKRLIIENEIIPEYAFVVPELSVTMPVSVALATGCDALAHAIEGFLNINTDNAMPAANDWALTAIKLIAVNLPQVISGTPSVVSLASMSAAATLGGMVIRYKPTGLPHLCSFSWFERIPHGIAVAILLEPAWRYYLGRAEVRERTMMLNRIFPGATPDAVVTSYRHFLTGLGMPKRLRDFQLITPELLQVTAQSAGQNRMKLAQAPRPVAPEQSETVLKELLAIAY